MIDAEDYGLHSFDNYYYNTQTDKFYYDTGVNYRELHISNKRNGSAFVRMMITLMPLSAPSKRRGRK